MRKILIILVVLSIFSITVPARADIAPPNQPPGTNPEPGSTSTNVRMVAETVTIDVQSKSIGDALGNAKVTADFTMRNMGSSEEKMAVRFPIGASDGWGGMPQITDAQVLVNGKKVSLRSTTGEDPNYGGGEVPWVEFDVTFPPQKDVPIVVKYTLEAVGEMPYIWFNYIFSTGAGWSGTIGSADLIVNFPYEINNLNVMVCSTDEYSYCTTKGGRMEGKRITWRFDDFEPEAQDNFSLYMVAPSEWAKVLTEKANIEKNSKDGEAWGRLGRAYKNFIFSPHGRRGFRGNYLLTDAGAQELFRLSDEAYSKALELKPNDALWHAGYADLLGYYAYYAGYEAIETIPTKIKALKEIKEALELAPNDETVKNIALDMSFLYPDGLVQNNEEYDFPWLTQTPAATATDIMPIYLTETPAPNSTPTLSNATESIIPTMSLPTQVVTESGNSPQTPRKKLPICGSLVLIPLMGFVWGFRRKLTGS